MAQNNNPHAVRFSESMEKHEKHDEVVSFAEAFPLSQSADIDKKFKWAQQLCAFLCDSFDEETVKAIRMDCACGPELGKAKKLKDIYEKESDLGVFAEKANRLNQGFTIEYDGKHLYLIYPQCYCSCVKRIDKPLPKAWCYCTLGYTKRMFEYILNRETDVELISSVKSGDAVCKIKIQI